MKGSSPKKNEKKKKKNLLVQADKEGDESNWTVSGGTKSLGTVMPIVLHDERQQNS